MGKTTLLKIMTGEINEFDGVVENIGNMKLGYLSQVYSDDENKTVREELRDGLLEIFELDEEIKIVEEKMTEDSSNMDLIEEYTSLLERFNNIG